MFLIHSVSVLCQTRLAYLFLSLSLLNMYKLQHFDILLLLFCQFFPFIPTRRHGSLH